ncbi:hypothetical protein D3C86_1258220 [compost metagenome]
MTAPKCHAMARLISAKATSLAGISQISAMSESSMGHPPAAASTGTPSHHSEMTSSMTVTSNVAPR